MHTELRWLRKAWRLALALGRVVAVFCFSFGLRASSNLGAPVPRVNLTFDTARAAFASPEQVPAELRGLAGEALATAFSKWLLSHDAEVRTRLERGEQDSLANLLMFGTSFTRQPRITPELMDSLEANQSTAMGLNELIAIFESRVADLINALAAPGSNERLMRMRHLVQTLGYSPSTADGRRELHRYLIADIVRVRKEFAAYAQRLNAARATADPNEAFQERSTMFQDRGISLDTSLLPNFALEKALEHLREQGTMPGNSIRRVAIIGPGLDFVDKDEGYDFYPPQTIQPFAVIENLKQLGLASSTLQVTTLDISSRVNEHLRQACYRAQRGQSYTVQLPYDPGRNWLPSAITYWEHFGDTIGSPTIPLHVPPSLQGIRVRAIRIRPDIVSRLIPVDLNLITSHLQLAQDKRFDLIVATNVFVYYSPFEQKLALLNIAAMLRDGGIFLSNDALPEIPDSEMTRLGDVDVPFSAKTGDGDRVASYQLASPPPQKKQH